MGEMRESFMNTAEKMLRDERSMTSSMREYVKEMKALARQNPERAAIDAREALIRTGVMTKDGEPKKVIVSWE